MVGHVTILNGRRYGTMHKVVSPDGRTLPQTFRGVVQGTPLELIGVFDRK
jgi:hypothetical protein